MTARKSAAKTTAKNDSKTPVSDLLTGETTVVGAQANEAAANMAKEGDTVVTEGAPDGKGNPQNASKDESDDKSTETAAPSTGASIASAFKLQTFTDLPPRNAGDGRATYPFRQMEPGQMFFVAFANDKEKATLSKKLSTAASQAGKAQSKTFAVRTIEDEGNPGVGVYCLRPEDIAEEATA